MSEDLLVIRADADQRMGTGHVMRMIALGQAWADRGGEVRLLGRIESAPLRARLNAEGFELVDVDHVHPAPADLAALLEHSAVGGWVALDGYHFDTAYMRAVRTAGRKTLVLDDINNRGIYEADVLLNQNFGAESYVYRVNLEARLLSGPRYAMLRREFRYSQAAWNGPHQPLRLLVTMGGSDPVNFSATVLRALALLSGHNLMVRLVVGPANPNRIELAALAATLRLPTELVTPGEDMPEHMAWADLAVTAAGSTCWELAHLGVPMLAFELAENQAGVLAGLTSTGAAVSGGRAAGTTPNCVTAVLDALLRSPQRLAELSARARALVDGQGACRMVHALRPAQVQLRPATPDDADLLLRWRNDPRIRKSYLNPEPVSADKHQAWLAAKLASPSCLLFIAQDTTGTPVGQIRLERSGNETQISLNVAPELAGFGFGEAMTRLACEEHLRQGGRGAFAALVRAENVGSLRMFAKVGFVRTGLWADSHGEVVRLEILPTDRPGGASCMHT